MLLSEMQRKKVPSSIEVTPSGITMLLSAKQLENASSPIEVTLSGIVILLMDSQYLKARPSIAVTGRPSISSGITRLPDADISQSVICIPSSYSE